MEHSSGPTNQRTDVHRQVVIEAARLFNQFGYAVTALDVVERELRVRIAAVNSIDRLLQDREALAAEAFDYAVERANALLYGSLEVDMHAVDQLLVIVRAFRTFVEQPPGEGGCPVFDVALQAPSALPFVEERARNALSDWRRRLRRIVRSGIKLGEVHPAADAEEVASVLIGSMEGAIFLHRIYKDAAHLDRSIAYLERYLDETVRMHA